MYKRKLRGHMECLEDRQMMAGDVHAFFNNGTLFINEADGHLGGHQAVQISHLPNGKIRVDGITSPVNPMGSLINGRPSVEFDFANNHTISVNLGAGQDQVRVIGTGQTFIGKLKIDTSDPFANPNDADGVVILGMVVAGAVEVTTGSGNDVVHVRESNIREGLTIKSGVETAAGSSDADDVFVGGFTGGRLLVTTGASADTVFVKDANVVVGGVPNVGPITINTGAGADTIKLGSFPDVFGSDVFGPVTAAGGIHIIAGTDLQIDVDTVKMQDVFVDQHIVVELGNGNDDLNMVNVSARKSITLAGQKGNDTMKLTEVVTLDSFFALMGEGDDTLDMTFVKAQAMTLDGGAGTNDKLRRSQMPFIPSVTLKGWEEIDGKRVLTVAPGLVARPGLRLSPV